MKLDVLGILIFMVCLLVAYVTWVSYVAFWSYIIIKRWMIQEEESNTLPGEIIMRTKFEQWVNRMYVKKFGGI